MPFVTGRNAPLMNGLAMDNFCTDFNTTNKKCLCLLTAQNAGFHGANNASETTLPTTDLTNVTVSHYCHDFGCCHQGQPHHNVLLLVGCMVWAPVMPIPASPVRTRLKDIRTLPQSKT